MGLEPIRFAALAPQASMSTFHQPGIGTQGGSRTHTTITDH